MIHFILGGARSGKTSYAEMLAQQSKKPVLYLATAKAHDNEMQDRIIHHQRSRPEHWTTREEPFDIDKIISDNSYSSHCILIDCLTLWVTNLLCDERDVSAYKARLLSALDETQTDVFVVSNETGMGVVPMGSLTRQFCDESGWLHQAVAAKADKVTLMVAGIPMPVKQ
ncbi:bifunctional adenosylcobinamide kinase/adenosylcobinamide-phosphate guanylyltransferase [Neptunomonas phycophila]|uniref:bifunctional adenosylcobinamide kinase/adenosylcobinamide-phosphate guanylyltransferase n=1 Tax=Neptunomonas phycophila TaxID=1572645 RepID=UPI0026E49151|nr:bifunctional adenosylcobinamide kinase/adenosylcobinamide-phosphate guanylyltransferase [Neptunomonas phycophila]MDO6783296.1 bifunctional adenosylcobinamide kinase/adenosylcobinamide-phosphate guanylyltransferase [Neptunomonas phycophila]